MKRKRLMPYFTRGDIILWLSSVMLIILSFLVFDRENYITLISSLIGVTSLIFCAKGNPIGQVLMIIFSIFYGIISWEMAYYGEMITYLGMTGPMAVIALISWLRHPYEGNRSQVKVNRLKAAEYGIMLLLTACVTVAFCFILSYFGTANIIPSTLSIATSFGAVYLTARRCEYYALVYAANDIVLIVLWVMAMSRDPSYISVVSCFAVFLFNDIYGYICWRRMKKRQERK